MARFHLNVRDGVYAPDLEGMELPDLSAARLEAIAGLRGILSQKLLTGCLPLTDYIEITDDSGQILNTVIFVDAITIIRDD